MTSVPDIAESLWHPLQPISPQSKSKKRAMRRLMLHCARQASLDLCFTVYDRPALGSQRQSTEFQESIHNAPKGEQDDIEENQLSYGPHEMSHFAPKGEQDGIEGNKQSYDDHELEHSAPKGEHDYIEGNKQSYDDHELEHSAPKGEQDDTEGNQQSYDDHELEHSAPKGEQDDIEETTLSYVHHEMVHYAPKGEQDNIEGNQQSYEGHELEHYTPKGGQDDKEETELSCGHHQMVHFAPKGDQDIEGNQLSYEGHEMEHYAPRGEDDYIDEKQLSYEDHATNHFAPAGDWADAQSNELSDDVEKNDSDLDLTYLQRMHGECEMCGEVMVPTCFCDYSVMTCLPCCRALLVWEDENQEGDEEEWAERARELAAGGEIDWDELMKQANKDDYAAEILRLLRHRESAAPANG